MNHFSVHLLLSKLEQAKKPSTDRNDASKLTHLKKKSLAAKAKKRNVVESTDSSSDETDSLHYDDELNSPAQKTSSSVRNRVISDLRVSEYSQGVLI